MAVRARRIAWARALGDELDARLTVRAANLPVRARGIANRWAGRRPVPVALHAAIGILHLVAAAGIAVDVRAVQAAEDLFQLWAGTGVGRQRRCGECIRELLLAGARRHLRGAAGLDCRNGRRRSITATGARPLHTTESVPVNTDVVERAAYRAAPHRARATAAICEAGLVAAGRIAVNRASTLRASRNASQGGDGRAAGASVTADERRRVGDGARASWAAARVVRAQGGVLRAVRARLRPVIADGRVGEQRNNATPHKCRCHVQSVQPGQCRKRLPRDTG